MVIRNVRKLALAGALAIVASSQAEAQQAVSVPGTPGWGANSGYPAASPWRKPWPRVGIPGLRGRQQQVYRYPAATQYPGYQGYSAPGQVYYYHPSATTPGYTQAAQPVYATVPQPTYAPATQPAAPAYAPAMQPAAPAAVQPSAIPPAPIIPGITTPATSPANPSS